MLRLFSRKKSREESAGEDTGAFPGIKFHNEVSKEELRRVSRSNSLGRQTPPEGQGRTRKRTGTLPPFQTEEFSGKVFENEELKQLVEQALIKNAVLKEGQNLEALPAKARLQMHEAKLDEVEAKENVKVVANILHFLVAQHRCDCSHLIWCTNMQQSQTTRQGGIEE